MDGLLGFLLAGVALAGSPGPATLSLAAAGAAFGVRRALAYMAGLVIGLIAVMGITATGVVGLLLALPGAAPAVTLLAAGYFIYLAFKIATAPPLDDGEPERRPPSFAGGVFLSLVNPKGYAAMAALFSGFALIRAHLAWDVTVKMILLVAIILAVDIAWLFAGAAMTRFFREPRLNRAVNLAFAGLLLASVALVLLV